MNKNNYNFEETGFKIMKSFFSKKELKILSNQFLSLLKMQAHKLGVNIDKNVNGDYEDQVKLITELSVKINNSSKNGFDQVNQMLREMYLMNSTIIGNNFFLDIVSELLNCPVEFLKYHIDGILTNFPTNEKRLYKYHVEQAYYPLRNNFLNMWIPIFMNKDENNGTMIIRPGGHKRNYNFIEYTGFSRKEGNEINEDNFFHQYKIPDLELEGLKEKAMILSSGDAVFFHQNMPHTSTINLSENPSFALVLRVYDFRSDYTLSNFNGIKPYTPEATKNGHPDITIY